MKFAAVLALAAGAAAWSHANDTHISYTTEVVTALTTYCPVATELTFGGTTYTVTEATTLTITDCPCTIHKPVTTISSVICNTCGPSYTNSTGAVPTVTPPVGTGVKPSPTTTPSTVPTAGAGRTVALSGAGLAGVLGLAAFVL